MKSLFFLKTDARDDTDAWIQKMTFEISFIWKILKTFIYFDIRWGGKPEAPQFLTVTGITDPYDRTVFSAHNQPNNKTFDI